MIANHIQTFNWNRRAWPAQLACLILAATALPVLAFTNTMQFAGLLFVGIGLIVIPFMPVWRIPYLLGFCYLFPRYVEVHEGWQMVLMTRSPEPGFMLQIGVVPFDGVLIATAIAILLPKLLRRERILTFGKWWGALFASIYICSIIYGFGNYQSPHDAEFAALWSLFRFSLMWVVLSNAVADPKQRKIIAYSLLACGVFLALGGIFRYITAPLDSAEEAWNHRASSFGIGISVLGALSILTGMTALNIFCYHPARRIKLGALACFFIAFTTVCLTFARGPMLVFIILTSLILFRAKKSYFIVWMLLVAIIIGGALSSKEVNGRISLIQSGSLFEESYRFTQYTATLGLIQDHPIIGVGGFRYYDAIYHYLPTNYIKRLLHSHSMLLQITAETGVFGLIAFVGFFATLILQGKRNAKIHDDFHIWRVGALYGIVGFFIAQLSDFILYDYRCTLALLGYIAITQLHPSIKPIVRKDSPFAR
ncbi:MAG: O-antigen ligase family protein [bacterium]